MPSGVGYNQEGTFSMIIKCGPGRKGASASANTVEELDTAMGFIASGLRSTLVRYDSALTWLPEPQNRRPACASLHPSLGASTLSALSMRAVTFSKIASTHLMLRG